MKKKIVWWFIFLLPFALGGLGVALVLMDSYVYKFIGLVQILYGFAFYMNDEYDKWFLRGKIGVFPKKHPLMKELNI
jgi:hypothetical protein